MRAARGIVALASPLAESALESITRLALLDDGFPAPSLQKKVRDPGRGKIYRVDMMWPERRFILEVDGRTKYTDGEQWREKKRETRLRALGFQVERILWADVLTYWSETSARLRRLLAAAPTAFPAGSAVWTG